MKKNNMRLAIACVAIITVGTTVFIGCCSKEPNLAEETNLETISEDQKSVDNLYNSFLSNHDFSISVIGEGITNYTVYGREDSEMFAIEEVFDGETYRGMRCVGEDENVHTILKVSDTKAELHIENFTSEVCRFTLDEITQVGDTVNFSFKCNDVHVAYCTVKLPDGTVNFVDMLSMPSNPNAKEDPKKLREFLAKLLGRTTGAETVEKDSGNKASACYAHMREQARTCAQVRGTWSESHGIDHEGCSGNCKVN